MEKNIVKGLDTNLYQYKFIDSILGCIYGNALGDAYGLATEFWDRKIIQEKYPKYQQELIPFPDYLVNRHNQRWDKGDWTDDTDQMILIMQMFTETNGKVDMQNIAKKLKSWIQNGFPELGDVAGMGLGQTVGSVVSHSKFESDPEYCSKFIWEKMNKSMAANGAVMRTSIVGCVHFNEPETVIQNTTKLAKLTHYDPRCIISCTTITLIISQIINYYKLKQQQEQEKEEKENDTNHLEESSITTTTNTTTTTTTNQQIEDINISNDKIEEIILKSIELSKAILTDCNEIEQSSKDQFMEEFNKYTDLNQTLEGIELDQPQSIGYTYKCMASGIWGLRELNRINQNNNNTNDNNNNNNNNNNIFRVIIDKLIKQGGDADTNGAVCGAVIGSKIGFSQLPNDMLKELPNKEWLDNLVVEFIEKVIFQSNNNKSKLKYCIIQ